MNKLIAISTTNEGPAIGGLLPERDRVKLHKSMKVTSKFLVNLSKLTINFFKNLYNPTIFFRR